MGHWWNGTDLREIEFLGEKPVREPLCATQIPHGLNPIFETTNSRSVTTTDRGTFPQINIKRHFSFHYRPTFGLLQIKDSSTETSEPDIM